MRLYALGFRLYKPKLNPNFQERLPERTRPGELGAGELLHLRRACGPDEAQPTRELINHHKTIRRMIRVLNAGLNHNANHFTKHRV